MALSWNKKHPRLIVVLFYVLMILLSVFLSARIYSWLLSIQANKTLLMLIPIVVFVASFLGLWVVYNYMRIFIFQQRGVKGYQLRGRITFYFLLVSLGSILVVGGLMVYLIFLIQNSFLQKESDVAGILIADYKSMIEAQKEDFEVSIENILVEDPSLCSNVFTLSGGQPQFILSENDFVVSTIANSIDRISNFFSQVETEPFYVGEGMDMAVIESNERYYVFQVPDALSDSFDSLVENLDQYSQYSEIKQHIQPISVVSLVIFSVPILIGTFFLSLMIARAITTNIEKLENATRIIAEGNLDHRVEIHSNDEIENLGENFNLMAHRLKLASVQVKRMERLEAWHEVAKRLAHEIKNPLTPIRLSAERLVYAYEMKRDEFDKVLDKTTTTIINEVSRLESLVNEFSSFARLPQLKLEEKNVLDTMSEVTDFFRGAYPPENLKMIVDCSLDEIMLEYDPNQLKQVLINLISNALEACTKDKKYVKITLSVYGNTCTITIEDKSGGIPVELAEKIFEPYFTTKEKGTGLGLAIAERIILEHSGNIWYEGTDEGTIFTIELPVNRGGQVEKPDTDS